MKKFFLIIIFCNTSFLNISAQSEINFQIKIIAKGDFVFFAVDQFENIYLLNAANQLKKINANDDSVAVFNSGRKFGMISQIDASNPLHILVFYNDFSTLLILDNQLSVRNTIDLRKQNIFQVQAVCRSHDNNIWLFDAIENKLKKINEAGNLILETADFRQLFGNDFNFISITEENELVYLYDPKHGVFIFDIYGALKNRIAITDWKNFAIENGELRGTKNDSLFNYSIKTFSFAEQLLPKIFQDAISIKIASSKIYVLKKNEVYRIIGNFN